MHPQASNLINDQALLLECQIEAFVAHTVWGVLLVAYITGAI